MKPHENIVNLIRWGWFKVTLPTGRSGDWAVQGFEVTKEQSDLDRLRAAINGHGRWVPPGKYTKLTHKGYTIMSDTKDEMMDHTEPIHAARHGGHCLVNGLGLGMVANAMLEVGAAKVTVVENSLDVIKLAAPYYEQMWGSAFEVVHSCAFEYKPPRGTQYNYVWHDIWPDISADNLQGMARLHRKYARRCREQGSWAKRLCQRERSKERQWLAAGIL